MAAPKRTRAERERDLGIITSMYLQRHTQEEIARELGLAQSQIAYDLKTVYKRWQAASIVDFNTAKTRELARIDELERLYMEAYRRSLSPKVRTHTKRAMLEQGASGEGIEIPLARAEVVREDQTGNATYLQGVQWCIEQRCKILGIYEATKITFDWRRAVEEQGYDPGDVFEDLVNTFVAAADGKST